ncbi:hypothetical protein [Thalassobacillus sp. CUG 92003]|uniref:hypothetical protein n=1 Tax=Thalassobacillus sp. CUG 92003 TaxID=2736641 RepID=UPI0015E66B24|nr:hypothetical protein [Thalassobacillus sp. CUG 92003]
MKLMKIALMPLLLMALTGCLYPNDQLAKNKVPNQQQLETVQNAVEQYQEQTSNYLPIKTKPQDTPIFQKYLLDFSALKQQGLISEAPGTAFENGGHYQYVLINVEENPTVKVLDLRTSETIRSINTKIDVYKRENGYPPFGKEVASGIYELKYEKLGYDNPLTVESPYSQKNLPVLINDRQELVIDYRKDIYQFMEGNDHTYEKGDDLRYLLTDHSPFVPGYSPPYTIEDGEPVFKPDLDENTNRS